MCLQKEEAKRLKKRPPPPPPPPPPDDTFRVVVCVVVDLWEREEIGIGIGPSSNDDDVVQRDIPLHHRHRRQRSQNQTSLLPCQSPTRGVVASPRDHLANNGTAHDDDDDDESVARAKETHKESTYTPLLLKGDEFLEYETLY